MSAGSEDTSHPSSLDVNLEHLAADLVGVNQRLRLMSNMQRQQGEHLQIIAPHTPGGDLAGELCPTNSIKHSGGRAGSRAAILTLKESRYSEANIWLTKRFSGNCLFAIDSTPQVLPEISRKQGFESPHREAGFRRNILGQFRGSLMQSISRDDEIHKAKPFERVR
jgi:hypothetical protein